jgi:hypothetical protein
VTRRQIPRLLLAVMTAGTGVAAWWAVNDAPLSPPRSTFLTRALGATVGAGTAQFRFTTKVTGPGTDSTSVGFGSVNFRDPAVNVYISSNQTELETTLGGTFKQVPQTLTTQEIATRQGLFEHVSFANSPISPPWLRLTRSAPARGLRALQETQSDSAISPLFSQSSGVRFVRVEPRDNNGPGSAFTRIPTVRTCALKGPHGFHSSTKDQLTVWLNGRGRIVQIRTTTQSAQHEPSGPDGTFTTVSTLDFTHFGVPVTISAPSVKRRPAGTGVAILNFRGHPTCSN